MTREQREQREQFCKVFISFVHEDIIVAQAVKTLLESRFGTQLGNRDVFLSADRWNAEYGENWFDRIKRELTNCKVLVSLLSKRSVKRAWINFEAGAAWLPSEKVLPVFFGNLRTFGMLPRPYGDLNAVDLRNDPAGLLRGVYQIMARDPEIRMIPPPPFLNDEDAGNIRRALEAFEDED